MLNPPPSAAAFDEGKPAPLDSHAVLDWLAAAPSARAEDELAPLLDHLATLRTAAMPPQQRHKVLDLLYARARGAVALLLPQLTDITLPLPRRARQLVRRTQDVLRAIAEDYFASLGNPGDPLDLHRPPGLPLWRIADALALHLLIGDHAASPPTPGIWRLLHQTYAQALHDGHACAHIEGIGTTLQDTYLSALLLACAQPASFNSREIALVADHIRRFGQRAEFFAPASNAVSESAFWIEAERDGPPAADQRRSPPEGALRFDCGRLAALAEGQAQALETGTKAATLDLPESFATAAGIAVLRRLADYWGHPAKRRFSRRRQNARAILCVGLETIWQLFAKEQTQTGEISSWMITNESPNGYALMHVSGKTARLAAGDVVALRTEHGDDWQVCLARWAQSENPEHFEIGLEVLSPSATPALLAVRTPNAAPQKFPALLLPKLPPLRTEEALLAPCGAVRPDADRLVLLIERNNLELREVRALRRDEETSSIEVLRIETDYTP